MAVLDCHQYAVFMLLLQVRVIMLYWRISVQSNATMSTVPMFLGILGMDFLDRVLRIQVPGSEHSSTHNRRSCYCLTIDNEPTEVKQGAVRPER